MDLAEDRPGQIVQPAVEHEEDAQHEARGQRQQDPQRQYRYVAMARGGNAMPVHREGPRGRRDLRRANLFEHARGDGVELDVTVRQAAIAAFETEPQAHVEQLEQVGIRRRILAEPLQQLEGLFAAPTFFVELLQQVALGPGPACAPGCLRDHLVDERAQQVAGRGDLRPRHALRAGERFELGDPCQQLQAQGGRVVVRCRAAQLGDEREQRAGGTDQRVDAGDQALQLEARTGHGRSGGGRPFHDDRGLPARRRHQDRAFGILDEGAVVCLHGSGGVNRWRPRPRAGIVRAARRFRG